MLEEGEFYVVVSKGRFRGLVGRYQSDEKRLATWHELVSFLPRDLRLATDAEVGRFIREADLEVLIP